MVEPNNDIDTETLQAQIDLSMAYAQDLVASWLQPASGSLIQSSSHAAEAEAELQALIRRPPRLGVGAPLPETPAASQTRLVRKLEGGKRRSREVENGAMPVRAREDEEEDGAEESRVGTIRKRARFDPFEPGGKKRKKVVDMGTANGVATEDAPRLGTMATVDAMAGPSPKRKKKKKKTLISEAQGTEEGVALRVPDGEVRSANHDANIVQREGSSVQSRVDEWDGPRKYPQIGRGNASGPSSSAAPSDVGASSSMASPKPLRRSPPISPAQQLQTSPERPAFPASSPPILNLTGPPPIVLENMEGTLSKKRKRKRKKKKPESEQRGIGDPQ
ncbi:hypothetical protein BJV78DRAFT_1222913 [Lactifluus subvellereus]|nr:hypothetical protein BJV78DRAFT_1222913 [Lactifluus subvellereus]